MKTFKILESFYVPCDPIEDYEDLQNETSIENDQYSRKFLRRDQVNLLVYVPCDPMKTFIFKETIMIVILIL